MPSAALLARITITAAFQRMKARMRRSTCSSPGKNGWSSAGIVLTYGVWVRAGTPTAAFLGPLEQLGHDVAGAQRPVGVDQRVERVDPFLGLAGVDVGQLMTEVVDHDCQFRSYPPVVLLRLRISATMTR